jgi:hypothetical protein
MKRFLILAAAFAGCNGESGNIAMTPVARGESSFGYSSYLDLAKAATRDDTCFLMAANLNPQAGAAFQAKLRFELFFDRIRNEVIVLSPEDEPGADCAWLFSESQVTAIDNVTYSVVKLPAVSPRAGGASTGKPAEIVAVRCLIVMAAPEEFDRILQGKMLRDLGYSDSESLASFVFPNTVGLFTPKDRTRLEVRDGPTSRVYQWSHRNSVLFTCERKKASTEAARKRFLRVEWGLAIQAERPLPILGRFLDDLKNADLVMDPLNVVCQTSKGTYPTETPSKDAGLVTCRIASGRIRESLCTVSVGGVSPLLNASLGSLETVKDSKGTGYVCARLSGKGSGAILYPKGTDWMLSYYLSPPDEKLDALLFQILLGGLAEK